MNADDRLDIAETLARHGNLGDLGKLDEIDTVFTSDTVYDMSAVGMPLMTGIDTLRQGTERMAAHMPVAHHVTNIVIVEDRGDEALVDSKGLLLMQDGRVQSVTHHDLLRRTDAGWRIARRAIVPQVKPLGGRFTEAVSA
jgi:hypothetical protein